jgi:FdhD protein
MNKLPRKKYQVHTVIARIGEPEEIEVINEAPVTLTVNGEVWLSFMCTPLDLEALAVGFLFNEGIINKIEEVATVRVCPDSTNIDVWLEHPVDKPQNWSKTSGCTGGITSVNDPKFMESSISKHNSNGVVFSAARVSEWVDLLLETQSLYRETGGVHTSALIEGTHVLVFAEDIGRHNTLDKIAGRCLIENIDPGYKIIITTGRISSEMLHKAGRIGATVLVSRSSPTALSIDLAEKYGITLIGYARRDQFKIYAHPQRILLEEVSLKNEKLLR